MANPPNYEIKYLPLHRANAESLRPYGQIIGSSSGVKPTAIDFYKGKIKMSYPVEFACDHSVEISLATMARRPLEVRYMERHFEHTQSFIPLNSKPFVAIFAPPADAELPDSKQIQAFLFDGSEGFCMHRGTWHEFPFALEDNTQMVVLLSTQTGYDLASRNPITEEAFGPDLDKKDLALRTGIAYQIRDEDLLALAIGDS